MTTASVMTYDSLVSDIQQYLERTDTATIEKIPLFIMLCEQTLAADLKFLGNLNVAASVMTSGNPVLDKPVRWHKTVSMNITTAAGNRQPVYLRKYEYLRNYSPDASATGTPLYYCDYDYTHWLVAPTPATALTFEVLYYERVQPLDSANQSNWFTNYAPQAMIYGTLLQAMPFLKNDERSAMWQQHYTQIVTTLRTEDVTRTGDRQAAAIDS
jgi:hypothetical protein